MREFEIKPELKKKLSKLFKKDRAAYEAVMKKIEDILHSKIAHYKNLRHDLKNLKRVHIGHFVLVFSYDTSEDFVYFIDFEHHDHAYE